MACIKAIIRLAHITVSYRNFRITHISGANSLFWPTNSDLYIIDEVVLSCFCVAARRSMRYCGGEDHL